MLEELHLTDALGNRTEGVLSVPDGAKSVVILSHGYSSSKESRIYRELQEEFNDRGIGTLRYDYYGHGPGYGHASGYGASKEVTLTKTVESLNAMIAYVRERDYGIGLLGSSFGGLISLVVACQDPEIKALALKSPVTEPIKFWRDRIGVEGIEQWKRDGTMHYEQLPEDFDLDYDFWEDLQSYDTLESARDLSCPTLIAHGDSDSFVPIEQSQALANVLGKEVTVVEGANHAYSDPGHYDAIKRLMIEFLSEELG